MLDAVTDVKAVRNSSNILVTWMPPFTLDLTNIVHDITYCVDIMEGPPFVNMLYSQCTIIQTEATFPLPFMSACNQYMVTVKPNNQAGNGTSASIIYLGAENGTYNYSLLVNYTFLFTIAPELNQIISELLDCRVHSFSLIMVLISSN